MNTGEDTEGGRIRKRRSRNAEEVKVRLASLCARSEQCEYDIRRKLQTTELSDAEKEGILDTLRKGKFFDDGRFARAYARDKFRFAGWGPRKIAAALSQRRIPSEAIREALEGIEGETTAERACEIGRQKARRLDLSQREDSARLLRYLASRGFSSSDCYSALATLRREQMEDRD